MKLDVSEIRKLTKDKVLELLKEKGSTFVTDLKNGKMLVQWLYVGNDSIKSLELDNEQRFEEISKDVWYYETVIPKIKYYCYWLHKNCNNVDSNSLGYSKYMIADKYSKNIFTFYKEDGTISSSRAYIQSIEQPVEDKRLKIHNYVFYSESLKENREINIVYPLNYDEHKKYKCLLISDGTPWRCTMHLESKLNELMLKNAIEPMIMCFIVQKDRNTELPMNKSFVSFIANDLPKFLQGKAIVENKKENFIFFGNSYGGLTGLYIDMHESNKIGTIICQSPSLWFDEKNEIINYYMQNNLSSNLYFSYGNCEIKLITEKAKKFNVVIKKDPLSICRVFRGEHEYFAWQDDLIYALKKLYKKIIF